MSKQTKGRSDCNQATSKTSHFNIYFTGITSRIKALIVTLALWGLIPISLANWISYLGGHHDE